MTSQQLIFLDKVKEDILKLMKEKYPEVERDLNPRIWTYDGLSYLYFKTLEGADLILNPTKFYISLGPTPEPNELDG